MEIGKENEGEMEKFASNSLQVSSADILRESLIHLQEHMVVNAVTPSASTCNIHVMMEFLLIILTDVLNDVIRHDKLFVLLARVRELTKEVFVLVRNLEENMNEASDANLNLLENIELLKEDLKNDFLKARADSSRLCFPMSDGPLFMTLLLTNLKDFVNSNASSVALIKKEIKQVKEDLEIIRSFFGYVEQELHRDLWTRVLDVAYEVEHAIHSILARDHGLLQLIFILPDTVEKIKLVKKEVQEKIPKSSSIIVANAPNKLVERNSSSTVGKIIVGFEEETKWIIRKLTSGPAEIDVISIVGMPGIGKTTLAFRVYNDKSIVDHFDVCAWCTVDQERNEKKLLQKIFYQVIGLKERFSEDDIDKNVDDKLRKKLCGQRYLIVLDDMWDTATLDELTRPFPELHKGSRVILTSRKKEVALHGKCHSDPLYLRLLRPEESWELLEKRVFGEERCPDELKDVGEKIARKCDGLPLVLDLIGGVISRKEKKEALWLEVLNNLSSFIFKDEEEVVKVIQLSYDHLSDHVKPCLVYLAIYPKDKDIRISKLKDLWIAQGIEMKSAEEVVDELISSSLVIPFDNSICKIHDLVHDFCYIKSRKEKLLHFIGGSKSPSSSSSSSDLMARGILIRFNKYIFRLNENFVVCNPEKKNPYVKHLLSLKVYKDRLPPKSHLKHLRLLKSLDLKGITLTDSLLNEIGMLVHLKYLIIQTKAKALPPSFSNLCNLETLMVDNSEGSYMILSPCFWSLAKLRDVRMNCCALFDPDINEPTVLDEDLRRSFSEYTHGFPLSLKIMRLQWLSLTSDTLSRIGRLPNLEELILQDTIIEEGKEWNMEDVTFQNLKSLKLEELNFLNGSFGDIASLELINVWFSPQLKESTFKIKEYVEEMTGEDKLEIRSDRASAYKFSRHSEEVDHHHSESSVTMNEDQLVELLDVLLVNLHNLPKVRAELISPSMTQYAAIMNKVSQVNSMLVDLLLKIIPVSLEVMHICCTNLKGSKSEEVGLFIKQLLEASPDILRESLIHLQEHRVNPFTPSASTCNIHVMIEFLLIILIDVPKDVIRHDKLFVLLARVRELTKEEDLKNDFLKARADSSQLCFPMSDGPLFMTLLLTNLKDLVNSNASSVALIKEEIKQVKEDLEIIRSFFGYVEQELHRDLWTCVLDVAYEVEHAINSILARDHGLLQLIFILPDTVEKIKLVKNEVQEKIPKSSGIIVANTPNKPVERNSSSTVGQIIVGFEEETEWIIRKLTNGPAEIDVISIVGMPGLGKTTLAYRVYNDKSIVDHFDVCAWCTVDQERNEKKLLQKIFNQVIGFKERFSENDIDDDIADNLRKKLCGKRYLIVLDDMWDTATLDELTRPFPEFHKGSRVILTSRKKEVALHGKCHSDPLYLRLLRSEESWELLEKRVFGEERCPDELKDVGEKIALKCDGLPLVLDLIGGVFSRKEKKEALWLEVLNNLSSFIFEDEEEVVKVIQLSYDHLLDHVKPCLVYLASYPKDEDILFSELKDFWISQGLVMKSAEEVVDELISSSLVIPFDNSICKIHDLVHDFCYIKSRKEKLFDFIGGSNALSSSSGMMARGITIRYDQRLFHLDENFVVFNPEKKNPYVKHLLSLKVYDGIKDCLSYKSHLKHLRLLKSLDLKDITLTDSLLNEISMLIHLKYLIIRTQTNTLPPSFSNLCNLETLLVDNVEGSCMILSPCFWSLAKLRDVRMKYCALFEPYINELTVLDEDLRLENLRTLSELYLTGLEDTEDIFKRFPKLQNLKVRIKGWPPEKICFPRLDVLNELEQFCLSASVWHSFHEYTHGFPLSLKKMRLRGHGLALTSDTLSRIARLPNLEELILEYTIIEEGKEWNMEDVTFQNLKSLKLDSVRFSEWNMEDVTFQNLKSLTLEELEFSEWQVDAEKSFPVLEKLDIYRCDKLMDIPDSFGDIASLELIKVWYSPQLKESTFKIKEYVEEMTGEDKLEVDFYYFEIRSS
ncbi:hypothetical protein H5410_029503 [Solanum commersonii]|uniref:NB-ARC domain-containing protein n=1 Tax=Solanum commersonii TaxID=4109 RepID=A0A9J5Z4T4_SOLCO|nr:hypothetical protein H5410_029503 [Solanum commersonii]